MNKKVQIILFFNWNILECGSLVWCKYQKHPYWPGIISKKIDRPNGTVYNVLFFGKYDYGL